MLLPAESTVPFSKFLIKSNFFWIDGHFDNPDPIIKIINEPIGRILPESAALSFPRQWNRRKLGDNVYHKELHSANTIEIFLPSAGAGAGADSPKRAVPAETTDERTTVSNAP